VLSAGARCLFPVVSPAAFFQVIVKPGYFQICILALDDTCRI
jgi:hypothetical protein